MSDAQIICFIVGHITRYFKIKSKGYSSKHLISWLIRTTAPSSSHKLVGPKSEKPRTWYFCFLSRRGIFYGLETQSFLLGGSYIFHSNIPTTTHFERRTLFKTQPSRIEFTVQILLRDRNTWYYATPKNFKFMCFCIMFSHWILIYIRNAPSSTIYLWKAFEIAKKTILGDFQTHF